MFKVVCRPNGPIKSLTTMTKAKELATLWLREPLPGRIAEIRKDGCLVFRSWVQPNGQVVATPKT